MKGERLGFKSKTGLLRIIQPRSWECTIQQVCGFKPSLEHTWI